MAIFARACKARRRRRAYRRPLSSRA